VLRRALQLRQTGARRNIWALPTGPHICAEYIASQTVFNTEFDIAQSRERERMEALFQDTLDAHAHTSIVSMYRRTDTWLGSVGIKVENAIIFRHVSDTPSTCGAAAWGALGNWALYMVRTPYTLYIRSR